MLVSKFYLLTLSQLYTTNLISIYEIYQWIFIDSVIRGCCVFKNAAEFMLVSKCYLLSLNLLDTTSLISISEIY